MSKFMKNLHAKLENYEAESMADQEAQLSRDKFWVSTGIPSLDYALGTFGFTTGIIEIAGASKGGKTTIALQTAATLCHSDPNAVVIYALSEERMPNDYAARLGVDTERVLVAKAKFVEDLFFKVKIYLDEIREGWKAEKLAGKPKVIVIWDSVSATNSRAELETFNKNAADYRKAMEAGKNFELKHAKMADFAKAAKGSMKAMLAELYENDIVFIAINHLLDDLGSPTGGKKSPGGSWKDYMPYLRLQVTRVEGIFLESDGKKEEVGQVSEIKVVKNDFGKYSRAKLNIYFGFGFVPNKDDWEFAAKEGIVKKEGASYVFGGKMKWNSPRTFFALYDERHVLLKPFIKALTKARHEQVEAENIDAE